MRTQCDRGFTWGVGLCVFRVGLSVWMPTRELSVGQFELENFAEITRTLDSPVGAPSHCVSTSQVIVRNGLGVRSLVAPEPWWVPTKKAHRCGPMRPLPSKAVVCFFIHSLGVWAIL